MPIVGLHPSLSDLESAEQDLASVIKKTNKQTPKVILIQYVHIYTFRNH